MELLRRIKNNPRSHKINSETLTVLGWHIRKITENADFSQKKNHHILNDY